ncbi:hypothetical protein DY052_05930 [Apilactobacillus timberlakei]|uniref:hypothetical protein n=1 Tax=Apilactobacillus timberlakei TaxID=2008380 RepID=UPI00112E3A38|nr:hypothetical protein [Apilactobacillus timberlakei]TPR14962.1 hypothetical protein DY052_05930 [Apilactobacillus timberlakei]
MKNIISAIGVFFISIVFAIFLVTAYSYMNSYNQLPSFEARANDIISSHGGFSLDDKESVKDLDNLSKDYKGLFKVVITKESKVHQPFTTKIRYKIQSNIKNLSTNSSTEKQAYTSSTYGE